MTSISEILAASYTFVEPPPEMTRDNTALLLIDIQGLATPEHLAKQAVAAGLDSGAVNAALSDYSERFLRRS